MIKPFLVLLGLQLAVIEAAAPTPAPPALPRRVRIQGQQFVLASTKQPIVLAGPNVVVKGPPYMPSVEGDTVCNDTVTNECTKAGTCKSCTTFTEADVLHLKSMGWNTIRLGIVWAGAQPLDSASLDPDFVRRLHAVLDLTDRTGIHVMLDNHGDMVGTAGCGNGVPIWVQQKAAPELIGKPLVTGFPYSIIPSLEIKKVAGYSVCGDNATKWAEFAGDPNYNLLNPCCQQMNSPNPGGLGYTTISQKTMDYILTEGPGRTDFVRFWSLVAQEVKRHPSAFAAELMNEPMSIYRGKMYDTWRACAEAINAIIPDMSVALADTGEGIVFPAWVDKFFAGIDIDHDTVQWIKASSNVFYAWHWYGNPKDPSNAVSRALAIQKSWNVPSFATEFMDCRVWEAAAAANISHSYWHYSAYCTTGPAFGNRKVPSDTFGACILGWAGGDSSHCSHQGL